MRGDGISSCPKDFTGVFRAVGDRQLEEGLPRARLEQQQRLNTAGGALPPAIGKPCMTEIYLHFTMRVFTYRCAAAMCGRSASPSSLTIAAAVALREADKGRKAGCSLF